MLAPPGDWAVTTAHVMQPVLKFCSAILLFWLWLWLLFTVASFVRGGPINLAQFFVCCNFIIYEPIFEIVSMSESIILLLKIPPHLKCVATLPCEMSLSGTNCCSIDHAISSLAWMRRPAVMWTLNIWCKNRRMWQLLQTITKTLNTLFSVVNFLKCVPTEVIPFSVCL